MRLDVPCCGALLYPRARLRNVETCGQLTKHSQDAIMSATSQIY